MHKSATALRNGEIFQVRDVFCVYENVPVTPIFSVGFFCFIIVKRQEKEAALYFMNQNVYNKQSFV